MSAEGWDTQEIKDLIQRAMKDITMRQLNLSLNKGIFEGKQKECKHIIKKIFEDLSTWASRTEAHILKQVDDVAERRRREMEEMSCSLICLPAQLAHHMDAVNKACGSPTKLKRIQTNARQIHQEAERIYPNGSSDALVSVEFHLSSLAQSLFLDGNTDELFRINTCLKPEQLFIGTACHASGGQILIEIGCSSPPIPIFILSEMNLCVLSAEQRLLVSVSLKTLYVQKHLVFLEDNKGLRITLSGQNLHRGSFINLTLISYSIKNSPALLKNSAWNNLGDPNNNNTNSSSFQNITRTGKPIDDLDESDLISMGYKHSDKSIFRDKSDILKNQACRSLLEQNDSRKISLPSEKTLIRLNPTPNVTPTIEGIAEIRNHHLMDEPDESIDPNSETLIDKGGQLHPLSSTIRCSQSPIGKQMHMPDGGGINSPFTDRNVINLPLDQPSPLNIHSQKQKKHKGNGTHHREEANGSADSNDATPCTSTQNNLSEKLRSISFPNLDDEEEDKEYTESRKKGLESLAKVQKLLTGEIQMGHAVEDSRHDKSVSFHPNTTIMEPAPNRPRRVSITSNVNVMDLLPEDKETNTICEDSSIFLEDVTDRSSGEELWQIRTGITKTTDGELTLCKTLMQSQNLSSSSIGKSMSDSTAWAYDRTLGGYTKSLKDSHRYTKPGHISFNESLWDNSLNASDLVQKAKPPKLNLSSEKINLVFVKKYPLEQIPQAITVDDLGYKYISHPDGNKITMLRGNDKKDYFQHDLTLKKPGYVLALPNERILVLDSRGFHMLGTDGSHVKTFLTDIAKDCRGLAYDFKYCHLLTTQKGENGSTLLVIDVEVNFFVIKKILIQPSADTPSNRERTKCVFLTYWNNSVFISDYGLGAVYVVYLSNERMEIFCRVSHPRGIRVDPNNNLLVTSSEQGVIRVYGPRGDLLRTLQVPQVKNIIDLYLDNEKECIYITDNQDYGLFQYRIVNNQEEEQPQ